MSLYIFALHVLSHNPFPIFLLNTYMVGCGFSAAALCGIHPQKIFQEPYLMGCRGKSGWVQKAILTSPIWFQDRRRQSLALYSVWNGEAGLLHIKTSWRTSLGLQYVSNLLSTILHAAQVTNIASDLVKIAKQERFLVLLDDQKPGGCNLLGIDSNRRCR